MKAVGGKGCKRGCLEEGREYNNNCPAARVGSRFTQSIIEQKNSMGVDCCSTQTYKLPVTDNPKPGAYRRVLDISIIIDGRLILRGQTIDICDLLETLFHV